MSHKKKPHMKEKHEKMKSGSCHAANPAMGMKKEHEKKKGK